MTRFHCELCNLNANNKNHLNSFKHRYAVNFYKLMEFLKDEQHLSYESAKSIIDIYRRNYDLISVITYRDLNIH